MEPDHQIWSHRASTGKQTSTSKAQQRWSSVLGEDALEAPARLTSEATTSLHLQLLYQTDWAPYQSGRVKGQHQCLESMFNHLKTCFRFYSAHFSLMFVCLCVCVCQVTGFSFYLANSSAFMCICLFQTSVSFIFKCFTCFCFRCLASHDGTREIIQPGGKIVSLEEEKSYNSDD